MVEKNDTNEEESHIPSNEILPEDIEVEAGEEELGIEDRLKELRRKLARCNEEKRTHLEELQRVRADYLNSRKRLEEQLARDRERATDKILSELLTLVDSFETAKADTELWNAIDDRWRAGVEAIHTKLLAVLKSNNVTPDDPTGLPFNPEAHEAVSNIPVTDASQIDTVITVLQKGFKRNGTTLRPARVVVGTQ